MKWPKFYALTQQHPWLREFVINIHLRSDMMRAGSPEAEERVFRSYVRRRIQYIAFRPFSSLDLDARNTDNRRPLRASCRFNPRTRGEQHVWTIVSYFVRFHFPNELPFSQGRAVTWQEVPDYDAMSVRSLLCSFPRLQKEWPCPEDKPWTIDGVVRLTNRGSYTTQGTVAYDIFLISPALSLANTL